MAFSKKTGINIENLRSLAGCRKAMAYVRADHQNALCVQYLSLRFDLKRTRERETNLNSIVLVKLCMADGSIIIDPPQTDGNISRPIIHFSILKA